VLREEIHGREQSVDSNLLLLTANIPARELFTIKIAEEQKLFDVGSYQPGIASGV